VRAPNSYDDVTDGIPPPVSLQALRRGMPRQHSDKGGRQIRAALRCRQSSAVRESCRPSSIMTFPWIRARANQRSVLPLNFPNHSRSFDPAQRCVSFWGHAATVEVTFQVGEDVLQRMSPGAADDEASLLAVFDTHRGVIETSARSVYDKSGQTFCRLYTADF